MILKIGLFSKLLWLDGIAFWSSDRPSRAPRFALLLTVKKGSVRTSYLSSRGRKVVTEKLNRESVTCCRRVMCCFTCRSVLVLWFCDGLSNVSCDVFFFFCESLQCSGFFAVDEAEGPDACAKIEIMRLCQMGAAVLATRLSLRLSLVALVSPVAQETLTSLLSFYDTIRQRQCVHSGTQLVNYSGRTSAYLQLGKKGPRHEFVPLSTAASTISDVLAHATDPTGLLATVRETTQKKKNNNKLLKKTEDTCNNIQFQNQTSEFWANSMARFSLLWQPCNGFFHLVTSVLH